MCPMTKPHPALALQGSTAATGAVPLASDTGPFPQQPCKAGMGLPVHKGSKQVGSEGKAVGHISRLRSKVRPKPQISHCPPCLLPAPALAGEGREGPGDVEPHKPLLPPALVDP